jgi:hypothetical protein
VQPLPPALARILPLVLLLDFRPFQCFPKKPWCIAPVRLLQNIFFKF